MNRNNRLQELRPLIDKCVLCGGCHAGCPTYDGSRMEHDSARGKVILAKEILEGRIKPDAKMEKIFAHCLSCLNCSSGCPAGADPVKIINAARSEIFKNSAPLLKRFMLGKVLGSISGLRLISLAIGIGSFIHRLLPPLPFLPLVRNGIKKELPPFSPAGLRDELPNFIKANPMKKEAAKQNSKSKSVAFFVGCMANHSFKENGKAVVELLTKAGLNVHIIKEELCCGAPAYYAGDHESAKKMAEKNLSAFSKVQADHIVTSCATCGSMLSETYRELLGEKAAEPFSSKVVDFQQLMAEGLMDELEFKKPEEVVKVTYHDPCHLIRGMGVSDAPRKILQNLAGVEYVELPNSGSCCGGAGSFAPRFYSDSLSIGAKKGDDIQKSKAEVVATACPSCRMQLMDITGRYAAGVQVTETATLICKMLKNS